MENRQVKSSDKHQHKTNNNEQLQRRYQQQELPNDQPKSVPPTKIIDLNDDCLMKIFHHLNLKNLYNVAVASE